MSLAVAILLIVAQLCPIAEPLACDRNDRQQADFFPDSNVLKNSAITAVLEENNCNLEYFTTIFIDRCIDWCRYSDSCASLHLGFEATTCNCYRVSLLRIQIRSFANFKYGKPCLSFSQCIAFTCGQKQRELMLSQFGQQVAEVPLMGARCWASLSPGSLIIDEARNLVKKLPEPFTMQGSQKSRVWFMIELPYPTRVRQLLLLPFQNRSGNKQRNQATAGYNEQKKDNLKIKKVYLVNWRWIAAKDEAKAKSQCAEKCKEIRCFVYVVGKLNKVDDSAVCIFGENRDASQWRASTLKKAKVGKIGASLCKLSYFLRDRAMHENISRCDFHRAGNSDKNYEAISGLQILVTGRLLSAPAEIKVGNADTVRAAINWNYWSLCAVVPHSETAAGSGWSASDLDAKCRNQLVQYVAIRAKQSASDNAIKLAEITIIEQLEAQRAASDSQIKVQRHYSAFICPWQYRIGFPYHFLGSVIAPSIAHLTDAIIEDLNSSSADYPPRILYNLATDFNSQKIFNDEDEADLRYRWIEFLIHRLTESNNPLEPSVVSKMRGKSAGNSNDWLGRSVYKDGRICFITCHWAWMVALQEDSYSTAAKIAVQMRWFVESFCPNPCANSPCQRVPNADPRGCHKLPEGLWEKTYSCQCNEYYEWSAQLRTCVHMPPCSQPRSDPKYPCNTINTVACRSEVSSVPGMKPTITCDCKKGFGGSRCDDIMNACSNENKRHRISGDFACGVADGHGQCESDEGQEQWRCKCMRGRSADLSLAFDNCGALRNSCDSLICIEGHFLSSPDGSRCHCSCKTGYSGHDCATWSGVWSLWSRWDRCRPECGNKRISISRRSCLVHQVLGDKAPHFYCLGIDERVHSCEKVDCWLGGVSKRTFAHRTGAQIVLSSAFYGCIAAILLAIAIALYCRHIGYVVGRTFGGSDTTVG